MDNATREPSGPEVSTADRVAAALRTEILEGRLMPGARLKDAHLSMRFAVSRNTMRDALRDLAASGLVSTRRHAGSSVRRLDENDVRDIYAVRRVLETQSVAASSGATAAQLAGLAAAIGTTATAVAAQQWRDVGTASLRFHQALVGLSRSARLSAFFDNILAELRLVFAIMPDESAFQLQWVERDRQIAEHVLAGRRDAASEALARYLNDSETLVIDAIRQTRSRDRQSGQEGQI